MLRARYADRDIACEGIVAAERIGKVFGFSRLPPGRQNAELPLGATLLDAPGGEPVAIVRRPGSGSPRVVDRIGAAREGHVLVRYATRRFAAVGWVPKGAVRSFEGGVGTSMPSGMSAVYGKTPEARVLLLRGDLLRAPSTNAVVGVVLVRKEYPCVSGCDGTSPRISVRACATSIELIATRRD